jgi:hypothetical protein
MEEDVDDELIVEGDRKRSRGAGAKGHVSSSMHVTNNQKSTSEEVIGADQNFLMAGPGRARPDNEFPQLELSGPGQPECSSDSS